MAGGQGTRLGHTGPKGTFKLDVYGKGKYLFEILAENLKEANKTYMVTIPWYIMTSRENNKMTRDFLEKIIILVMIKMQLQFLYKANYH